MTLIFAHRGSSGTHPENTMESFMAAEAAQADGIELDVHLTKDGEIAVIHDEQVDRTTNGTGWVKDFTLKELKRLKANYHYKHFFKRSAHIPSLRDVFDWMKGNTLLCNIELKNSVIGYEGLEDKVIRLINEYAFEERVIISSFNHYSLVYIANVAPQIETAPLYNEIMYQPWFYAMSIRAKGIHPKFKTASPLLIQQAMENGLQVRPYTVNKQKDMKSLFLIRCSALITDYPQKAVELRKSIENKR